MSVQQPLNDLDGVCNCLSTRKAARYLTAVYDKALAPSGIRITQFTILHKLARLGPMGVKEIARAMAMDRTTLAANLKPLEREGWLCQAVDPDDRRARLVQITDEGQARLEQSLPLWRAAQSRFQKAYGAQPSIAMRGHMQQVLLTGFDPWAE